MPGDETGDKNADLTNDETADEYGAMTSDND